jgi:hypothetical protein
MFPGIECNEPTQSYMILPLPTLLVDDRTDKMSIAVKIKKEKV